MKQLFTLLISAFLCLSVWGQNTLFIPFGQTADEVKRYLRTKDYILKVQEDEDMQSLKVELDVNKHVEYAFDEGALYAVTVTRTYEQKRVAGEIQKNCLDYMDVISRGAVTHTTNDNITCYTAVTESRVFKLFVISHKNAGQTLQLTAVSRHYGPMIQDKDFYYEVELLQNKFISN